jgi:hypothetical protein
MKYILIVLVSTMLTGCVLFAKPKFPDAEESLMVSCKELTQLPNDTVTISQLMSSVVNNYTLYHQCALKVAGWQEWYNKQKKNYDDAE